jgi:hypothetical protein
MGFGLVIGFIGHLYTVQKSLLHSGQCSQSCRSVTASIGGRSSASGLMSLQAGDRPKPASYPQLPWLQLSCPLLLNPGPSYGPLICFWRWPTRKHRLQYCYWCESNRCHSHMTVTESLPSNRRLFTEPFPSNSHLCWFHNSCLSKPVTI